MPQAMVALCCMPWTVDPLHEELLVLLVITLSAWPDPHSASFVEALSRVPRKAMSDLVGSKLLQVRSCLPGGEHVNSL